MPIQKIINSINAHHEIQNDEPSARRSRTLAPFCDCKESNIAAGITRTDHAMYTDTDIAWVMVPTVLNKKSLCLHCNYVPFYKEISND